MEALKPPEQGKRVVSLSAIGDRNHVFSDERVDIMTVQEN
jgi:hypothetical protein